MENKQTTAVEWLIENMPDISNYISVGISLELHAKFQQAIAMEREQIYKSFDAGSAYAIGSHVDFKQTHPNKGQYYEQTYGTTKSR